MRVTLNGDFPDTVVGVCSPAQPLIIENVFAEADLLVSSVILTGSFFFDDPPTNQNAGPLTIPGPNGSTTLDVFFCPVAEVAETSLLTILSNDPDNNGVYTQNLTGTGIPPAP
jgi:hypothetical protein